MLKEDGSVVLMKLNVSSSGAVKPKLLFPKPVQIQTGMFKLSFFLFYFKYRLLSVENKI